MPNPRCSGPSRSIRRSSSQMLPAVSGSSPARQFSAVDLPQPDGPSRAMNSPRPTSRSTPFSAFSTPKLRLMPWSRNARKSRDEAMGYLPTLLPTCWSQRLNANTSLSASSGSSIGLSAISEAYSARPYSRIASWLSFGAISSGTPFTAGPG